MSESRQTDFGGFEPFVTVVVRSKDRIPWLLELLERLFAQTYRNFEVLVVDSSTSTPAAELARLLEHPDPRVRVVRTPPRGCSAAANAGVHHARGEILVSIDDDDLPADESWLWHHVRNYRDASCLGVNGFQDHPTDFRTELPLPRLRQLLVLEFGPFKEPYILAQSLQRKVGIDFLNGGNSSIRRSAALLGGGWDEFLGAHDNEYSLFLRLHRRRAAGTYLVYDPEARAIIRKDAPGGVESRVNGEVGKRVDTLAKYFIWVVAREHPARIYGLAPLFVPYFSILAGAAGHLIAVGRGGNRGRAFVEAMLYAPFALAKHLVAPRPPAHDGFPETEAREAA